MDYDYDSLVVLAAVVRTGSFEGAAKSLDVTQSAVSQRIKQLEEKVGSILVLRGRPCVATEDGLLLCQHVDQVALLQHELKEQLANRGDGAGNAVSIRIAVNTDSLATWFPEVMERAAGELNLRLEIVPDDQEFTEERLKSGDALAIVTATENAVPGCKTFSLGAMEYMAVASQSFLEKHLSNDITLESVAAAPSLQYDRKDTLPRLWMQTAFGKATRVSAHQVPSYEGHMQCAARGIGWAIMPTESVLPAIESGALVELVPDARINMPLYWQSRSQASSILGKLADIVRSTSANRLLPLNPLSA